MLIATKDIKMQAGTVRNFYICDPITADRQRWNWHLDAYETIESKTSQRYFVDNLQGLGAADTVNLYINCMGGSVKEALGIYNVLRRCPARIIACIDGFAASAASVIAMAAELVIMPRNTAMMIHNARCEAYGNPAELRKAADDLDVINTAAIQSYTMHAGEKLPQDKLQQMLDAETWLTAEECVQYGLADQFAEEDADLDTALEMFSTAAQAAMNGPDEGIFKSAPAFLADRYTAPAAAEPKEKNHSCVYMLLKSMTK